MGKTNKGKSADIGILADLLQQVPAMKDLGPKELQAIAKAMRAQTFGDGEAIVRQGEAGAALAVGRHRLEQAVLT